MAWQTDSRAAVGDCRRPPVVPPVMRSSLSCLRSLLVPRRDEAPRPVNVSARATCSRHQTVTLQPHSGSFMHQNKQDTVSFFKGSGCRKHSEALSEERKRLKIQIFKLFKVNLLGFNNLTLVKCETQKSFYC